MNKPKIHVVTGAFGFTGQYIAKRLIDRGHKVSTLTNSLNRSNPFNGNIKSFAYHFDDFGKLVASLEGASVLYNNYWVRFNHEHFSYAAAVENTLLLFKAAEKAGVKRIVHISITNPSEDSPFEYFRGKAVLEKALMESGLSYAILRPAVIFGKEDILINNIAWCLRKFPVFGIFGKGDYKLQPINVEDLAAIAIKQGKEKQNNIIDAIGPETFTYRQLVALINTSLELNRPIISIHPRIGYTVGSILSTLLKDVMITQDEIRGLMGNLLYTESLPLGKTKLSEWINKNVETLGKRYSNELKRRNNKTRSYLSL